MTNDCVVRVAVGVICRGDLLLIAKRPAHLHMGDLWEFPGGKIESGETLESALLRELNEELGVTAKNIDYQFTVDWDYPDKRVSLEICLVNEFSGEAHGREGQQIAWVKRDDLLQYKFPEANKRIVGWVIAECPG